MHTRNPRVVTASALALAMLMMSGCDTGLTSVNEDPNAPVTVPIENVLLSGLWDVVANDGGRGVFGQWTQLYHAENWAQHVAQPIYNDEDKYTPRPGIVPVIWNEMYYALEDLKTAETMAEASGDDNVWAVAEIMSVYGFMLLTDYYGDIPYEEALRLDEDIAFPEYTPQSEIYPDLIARLAAASSRIDVSAYVTFEDYDPIYHGDMAGWRKFANSLQLRLAMRMSNTSASTQAAQSFQAAWNAGVFSSVADNADVEWTISDPSANPMYEGIVLSGRSGDFRMSSSLIDRLTDLNDPRLPIYADPAVSDGVYRGLRNGLVPADYTFGGETGGPGDFSQIGSYFLKSTTPSDLMTYAEVLLLGAEAAARGWMTGDPATMYEDGIAASMKEYGIAQADIDTYLAQPEVAYTGMDDIWLQEWLALFLAGPEAFSEMRRVGWMDLQPAENSSIGDNFPERLYYPPDEALYNPANYPGDIPITTKLWWAGGS